MPAESAIPEWVAIALTVTLEPMPPEAVKEPAYCGEEWVGVELSVV